MRLAALRPMVYTNAVRARKRSTLTALQAFLVVCCATFASPVLASDDTRVRSTNPVVLAMIREGSERSATFRRLLDQAAESDGIVYVEFGYCAFGHLNGCLLPLVVPSAGGRYLRILVTPDTTRVSRDRQIALIAHELQHTLEVLAHPEVVDVDTMLKMYARIGVPLTGRSGYETTAAHTVEDAVLSELLAKQSIRSRHENAR